MNLQIATIFVILTYCRNFAFGDRPYEPNLNHLMLSPNEKMLILLPPIQKLQLEKRVVKHDIDLKYLHKQLHHINDECIINVDDIKQWTFGAAEIYIRRKFLEMKEKEENKKREEQEKEKKQKEKNENKTDETELPRDCAEILAKGNKTSGVYQIYPKLNKEGFPVWCDMTNQGGGWISILNRFDGSQNFFLNWTDYKEGFGELTGEHWLGLQHLHELTYSKQYELLVQLSDWNSVKRFARYSYFKIGDESTGYSVENIGQYNGNAGNSLHILGYKFSTLDRNQDAKYSRQYVPCAQTYKAGWWFSLCAEGILTGEFIPHAINNAQQISAITWETFKGIKHNLKTAQMLIRSTENK